jgi:hypothetical protein
MRPADVRVGLGAFAPHEDLTAHALLYNAGNKTWSVLRIDGEQVTVLSTHATKLEAERELARVKSGGARSLASEVAP